MVAYIVRLGLAESMFLNITLRGITTLIATAIAITFAFAVVQANSQTADNLPRTLDFYEVQCGILSSEGLPAGAKPRFTLAACKLVTTISDNDVTKLDFTGRIYGRTISWTFEGNAKLNVFKQLAPQTGGKFNRSVRNGLACFVPFDEEGLDDVDSFVCYKRSTLRKIYSWDRKSGAKVPLP